MTDALSLPSFARVHEYAGPWMIYPPAAELLLRHAEGLDLVAHVRAMQAAPARVPTAYGVETASNGRKVAVVPLLGPMMKGQSSLGGASTVAARRMVRQAAADPEIAGILLAVDSPGGTVAGTADLAADVRSASRKKPVIAHADDLMASAAYWVGSQADEIYANAPTALIGSIGTMVSVTETTGRADRLGIRERVFTTGPLKAVGGDSPITDEQSAYLQNVAESLQTEFDAAVKRGRRLSAAQMAEVKSGAVYPAARAQELGLINGVRSLSQSIEALASAH